MDKRKLIKQTEISIADQINTRMVNLEVANTIENMEDLKTIVQAKANQSYYQACEESKIFTHYTRHYSLEEKPKSLYLISVGLWIILYKKGAASRLSGVLLLCGLSFLTSLRNYIYIYLQDEYKDYKMACNSYMSIIKMKTGLLNNNDKLSILIGAKTDNFNKGSFILGYSSLI